MCKELNDEERFQLDIPLEEKDYLEPLCVTCIDCYQDLSCESPNCGYIHHIEFKNRMTEEMWTAFLEHRRVERIIGEGGGK